MRLVWRRKWIALAIVVLIPAAVYAISSTVTKTYEASTTLRIQATNFSSALFSNQVTVTSSSTDDAARLIQTTAVAKVAAKELNEPPSAARSLLGHIGVSVDQTTSGSAGGFLTITARDSDPKQAAEIANAFARAVTQTRTDTAVKSIDRTIASLQGEAAAIKTGSLSASTASALADQLQQLRALKATQQGTTQVIEPAVAPSSPISPNPRRNTILALVVALLLAAGLVSLLDGLDRKIHETSGIEELVGAPLLAMIPRAAFPGNAPGPHAREAFQTLRAGLTYFNVDKALDRVLITSATHSEGKTTVSVNLAAALAQDGKHVVLVDGDLRRPQVAARVGAQPRIGLAAVLLGERKLDDALIEIDAGGGRLQILPSMAPQPPNPSVLLGSERMKDLLAELAERADIVIIDTPPILAVSDAIPLLERVSGSVLVARLDHTSRDAILRARLVIKTVRGNLLGVVATGARSGGLYGDGLGYDYGYSYGGYTEKDSESDDGSAGDGSSGNGAGPLATGSAPEDARSAD